MADIWWKQEIGTPSCRGEVDLYWAKHYVRLKLSTIISFNLHSDPTEYNIVFAIFTNEETIAQGHRLSKGQDPHHSLDLSPFVPRSDGPNPVPFPCMGPSEKEIILVVPLSVDHGYSYDDVT